MSCLEKLKNGPGLDAMDSNIKAVTPSVIGSQPLAQKLSAAKNTLTSLTSQIATQITNQLNNALSLLTGKFAGIIDQIKGVEAALESLGKTFLSAFKQAQELLQKQYKNLTSLIDCEIDSASENNIITTQANEIQSSLSNLNLQVINNLNNNQAKVLSENIDLKNQFISKLTNNTLTKGVDIIAFSPNPIAIVKSQRPIVDSLGGALI